jgi:hypothetical protein
MDEQQRAHCDGVAAVPRRPLMQQEHAPMDMMTMEPSSLFQPSAQYAAQPMPTCFSIISTMKSHVTTDPAASESDRSKPDERKSRWVLVHAFNAAKRAWQRAVEAAACARAHPTRASRRRRPTSR